MYYAIPRAGVALGASLLGLGLLLGAGLARAQEQPRRYLEVSSQGYSRYEISDGDVVAFFTGGVQCVYLGYTLTMDELRYNQATQVATASGKVNLASAAVNLQCDSAVLDGASGKLVVDSNLAGTLSELELAFTADSAIVHFPPGDITADLDTLDIELIGTGDAGVRITGPQDSVLTAHQFRFAGNTRMLTCPGRFEFTAELEHALPAAAAANDTQLQAQHVQVTGSSLDAVLHESGMVRTATVAMANLASDSAELSSQELQLEFIPPPDPDVPGWAVEASGTPITGRASHEGQVVAFTTQHARVADEGDTVDQLELRGEVEVATASGVMYAEVVQVRREQRGFAISAPQGLRVAFDLAALSGSTPVDLPELSKFSPQE